MAWPLAPLRELIAIHYGKSLSAKIRKAGTVPVFGSNGVVGSHDEPLVHHATIVIGRKGSVGELNFCEVPCFPIDTTFYVEVMDSSRVNLRYLYRAMQSINLKRHIIAVGVPGINREDIYREKIPVPPLAEQQRIVEILDRASAIQRLRRAADDKAREIIPALFVDMFGDPATNPKGWPITTLDACAVIQGGLQVSAKRNSLGMELPYLRVANVFRGKLDLSEIKTMRVTPAEAQRARLEKGDILVVEGHGNPNELGRAAIWNGAIEECLHQNHLIRIRLQPEIVLPDYGEAFLNSEAGRMILIGRGKTTSGLNTISTQNVRDVSLAIPPLALQQDFVRRASAIKAVSTLHSDAAVHSQNVAGALTAQLLG